ncbi:MAG TPA: autorepressor SdpR family transcription factor [Fimbriimonadaceae bacterium]|nr:autorepressor SdpR family transcription factor [Fimbriimonadaceae bacterium]
MAWDDAFRALSDPTRRSILRLLRDGERSAGEIARHFETSAPAMSHHLTVLKQSDLVEATRNGQQIVYSLNTSALQDVVRYFLDTFATEHQTNE